MAERPLAGRTAVVTGSTGEGMGRQIAWTLAREGANVVLNYGTYRRSEAAAQKVVKQVESLGAEAIAVRADTRSEADNARLVREAKKAFGRVDIAVANAGGDYLERAVEKVSLAEWRRVVGAELDGAFLLAKEALPAMRRRTWGRLVFISWEGAPRWFATPLDYTIGKLARDALAEKLARLEEAHGVTVNTVAPGYIPYLKTREAWGLMRGGEPWEKRPRSGPQDTAECVAWLCREEARFVTGSYLRVYGPWEKER